MKMKRHNKLKAAVALILCAFIVLSGISTETAFAANKKIPLKVKFNGAEVSLIKDIYVDTDNLIPLLSSLKKKWGTPKIDKHDGDWSSYTWKKGKTRIEVNNWAFFAGAMEKEDDIMSGGSFSIKDKNASVWGVKVGMTKDAALKKIKKALGIKKVYKTYESGVCIVAKKKSIEVWTDVSYPVTFELKNGKVTCISWLRS